MTEKKIFDDAPIDVACPGCGHNHQKTLGWLQAETKFTCEGCGADIALDNSELRDGMKGLDDAWNNVLGAFGKK